MKIEKTKDIEKFFNDSNNKEVDKLLNIMEKPNKEVEKFFKIRELNEKLEKELSSDKINLIKKNKL
jgi:hypothetical protein